MDTGTLKKFAQEARRVLRDQVSAKLAQVLADNSAARREAPKAVQQLAGEIGRTSRDQVIERVAYTWFNRFTALRFMDANGYTSVRVVTPANGQTRPEILSEAMAGGIGGEVPEAVAAQVRALLDNRTPSREPQGEAYRLLLVAACNHWHAAMPFMFETIADYTELLMPEDLLSQSSILARLRTVMTEEACQDVEIIGWLYQFYISEKKDEVFAGLKKNKKITPENIPAATQLFTPHWIVRYLVENSLGRLWMLNRPNSRLKERMDYYIVPDEPDTDFLRIASPEEIKVCDPACGSGHMLTYAFDLLYSIYEEEGYDAAEIPGLILTCNLYGIELDERAGALAAFALTMKAAARRKRFLRRGVQPNVCVLQPVKFEAAELGDYMNAVGRDLFTTPLLHVLTQFEEADNFGSLIQPDVTDIAIRRIIESKDMGANLFLRDVHERVVTVLRMAEFLSSRYQVVVANPPYMSAGGMNTSMKAWSENRYPDSASDTFSMFIERASALTMPAGLSAMVTMQNWLFLSSFEALREKVLDKLTLRSLCQIGYNSFPEMNSKVAQAAAFVIENAPKAGHGYFFNLNDAPQSADKGQIYLEKLKSRDLFSPNPADFRGIPGSPIAYWATDKIYAAFKASGLLSEHAAVGKGLDTGDNDRFMRLWHEVANNTKKWSPCQKGGPFRKWYGNKDFLLNWENGGAELKRFPKSNLRNSHNYFKAGISWTRVSSAPPAFRYFDDGQLFESTGPCVFSKDIPVNAILGLLNSNFARVVLGMLAPSLDFQSGHVSKIPVPSNIESLDTSAASQCVSYSRSDWDAFETSADLATLPLLSHQYRTQTLEGTYARLRAHWSSITEKMKRLEEENNLVFINAFSLQEELTPEVPLEEVTLNCNPAYRYGGKKSEAELEGLLLADTMREFVSYAVGCALGRYSIDAPGLILANRGEGLEDYLAKVPNPIFEPDADNVIPVLDDDWFADDIVARFRKFLRVTFGEGHFQENLAFIEEALGKDIRKYFTRDFYTDHVKRYKKRPIYWLFSSPKGTFNALIYMHRYRSDTVSVVLNDYLREFRSKLETHRRAQEAVSISGEASPAQKAKALKEIEATVKQIEELDAWERDVLFPLATQKIEIDLDDGVKVNYPKFGAALKPIKGLNDGDD
ncbi:BREX-1 system adenine-specific DNA-methyltransferase PglX [Agrobacterium vitis]|nr:BREX-1 system adenine-specific DNA-methyltransferase PglX [Agrobacterium vitis]